MDRTSVNSYSDSRNPIEIKKESKLSPIKLNGSRRGSSSASIGRNLLTPMPGGELIAGIASPNVGGQSATSNTALTELPPQNEQDAKVMAVQAVIDSFNALSFAFDSTLVQKLQALGSKVKSLSAGLGSTKQTAQDGFTDGSDESAFRSPVSIEDPPAPLEGAIYEQGKTVFANQPESKVKAVYRVQLIFSIGFGAPLPVFPVSFPLGTLEMMVPVGFLYQLESDNNGFIYQMPIVPKVEAGLELDFDKLLEELGSGPVGALFGLLKPWALMFEGKAETTIEQTFIWIRTTGNMAFRILAVLIKLFNLSPNLPFRIGVQSCMGNPKDAQLPIPFMGGSGTPASSPSMGVG